ncbi:MAG: HAD family hydrolase [Lachnospiraceae bacterium]|nr:HAD family hydrolase [Lachnospiraceae bacterium]
MDIKAVLFDLDGTLLPMNQDEFIGAYFKLLAARMATYGYEPQKLVESVWSGTKAMIMNDGSCTNETAFWNKFVEIYGDKVLEHKGIIDDFYTDEFNKAKAVCGFNASAKKVVEHAKTLGKRVVLATNPLFPAVATKNRMNWAGLIPEDFEYFTTYENSNYCKPNLKYYEAILEHIGCKPEECLMVGNDVSEDMVVEKLGMKVFLLTDCLINKNEQDISQYPQGGFEELIKYLSEL